MTADQIPMARHLPRLVGVGISRDASAARAVREAVGQLETSRICFVLVFVPHRLNHAEVETALAELLPSTPGFGCTTAGQITPEGYEDDALLIVAFPREHFRCSSALLSPLKPVMPEQTALKAKALSRRFGRTANWNRFGLIFADGLSKQEDILVAALEVGLGDIPVFGGSAGHGLAFDRTFVLHGGEFHEDAAVLVLVDTDLDFTGLGFDHFTPTEQQIVVTEAQSEERVVHEINGSPAASEYARLVGCAASDLSPRIFAENPVMVRSPAAWHVRAIQQVIDGTSLTFLSAIANGLVLTLGRGKDILATLDSGLSVSDGQGREPDFILGFDCVLRRLEIQEKSLGNAASRVLRRHRVLGFNTYGEQHCGVHVNQTFVGIAFFPPGRANPL